MDTEDLIFGYTPEELGLDPITRDFINCDRMVERNDLNLPELEGTPKQIKWAEEIRERAIAKYKSRNVKFPKMLIQVKTAKWFIDNQDSF